MLFCLQSLQENTALSIEWGRALLSGWLVGCQGALHHLFKQEDQRVLYNRRSEDWCFFSFLSSVKHSKQIDAVAWREMGPRRHPLCVRWSPAHACHVRLRLDSPPCGCREDGVPCAICEACPSFQLHPSQKGKNALPRSHCEDKVSFLCPFANSRFLITRAPKKRK